MVVQYIKGLITKEAVTAWNRQEEDYFYAVLKTNFDLKAILDCNDYLYEVLEQACAVVGEGHFYTIIISTPNVKEAEERIRVFAPTFTFRGNYIRIEECRNTLK